jgi:hypothetical protein
MYLIPIRYNALAGSEIKVIIGASLMLGAGNTSIINITASTNNYNLGTALTAAGWNGTSPVRAVVTIASGVTIGSASTSTPAFIVPSLPSGSVVSITNNGTISGAGGTGGTASGTGYAGGNALQISSATTITNNGTIAGGGGGGGGSIGYGGGGAGTVPGAPGGGTASAGTATAGGSGSGAGGAGGGLGSAGVSMGQYYGGSPGYYVVGSAYVSWAATGTRLGSFS